MPVLLVLCSLQREQMRHGVTLPCFTCFWVRLCSSCPFCYLRWQGWPCHMGAGPCACLESPCKGCVLLYPCGSVVHVISAFQKETAWFSGFCLMGERGLLCFPQFQGGYSIEKYYKHHCVFTCMLDLCYSGVFLIVLGGKKKKKGFWNYFSLSQRNERREALTVLICHSYFSCHSIYGLFYFVPFWSWVKILQSRLMFLLLQELLAKPFGEMLHIALTLGQL